MRKSNGLSAPVACRQSTSWDSKQLATCLQVSAAVAVAAAAVAVTVVDATRRALLGVYLIFHMPPQLLPPRRLLTDQLQHHHTAPHCTTTAPHLLAMSTAYTSSLAAALKCFINTLYSVLCTLYSPRRQHFAYKSKNGHNVHLQLR